MATIGTIFLGALPAAAATVQPTPAAGEPSDVIGVTGSGFTPGRTCTIHLNSGTLPVDATAKVADCSVDAGGSAQGTFSVPALSPGNYTVWMCNAPGGAPCSASSSEAAEGPFRVNASSAAPPPTTSTTSTTTPTTTTAPAPPPTSPTTTTSTPGVTSTATTVPSTTSTTLSSPATTSAESSDSTTAVPAASVAPTPPVDPDGQAVASAALVDPAALLTANRADDVDPSNEPSGFVSRFFYDSRPAAAGETSIDEGNLPTAVGLTVASLATAAALAGLTRLVPRFRRAGTSTGGPRD